MRLDDDDLGPALDKAERDEQHAEELLSQVRYLLDAAAGTGVDAPLKLKSKAEDGLEENRWKLKSGTAIVYLPVEMT